MPDPTRRPTVMTEFPRPIVTARLVLAVLPAEALAALAENDVARASSLAGCDLSGFPEEERGIARLRHADLAADPEYLPWSLRAMCLRPEMLFAGYCNFHSRPNPAYLQPLAPDAVELGYYVLPAFRRRGLAAEAARGMMAWARDVHGVRRFVVSIDPGNRASCGLARKLGFVRIGSHIDAEDGYEDIYCLDSEAG